MLRQGLADIYVFARIYFVPRLPVKVFVLSQAELAFMGHGAAHRGWLATAGGRIENKATGKCKCFMRFQSPIGERKRQDDQTVIGAPR